MFAAYDNEIRSLDRSLHTVGGILYSIVSAVCNSNGASDVNEDSTAASPEQSLPNQFLSNGSVEELAIYGTNATFSSIFSELLARPIMRNDMRLCDMDDCIRQRSSVSSEPDFNPVTEFEMHAYVRNQIYRLLGDRALPLVPLESAVERSVKESELLTFTSLSVNDLFKYSQLLELDEMVASCMPPKPNFTGLVQSVGEGGNVLRRRYSRNLSALGFAQILSKELSRNPKVLKKYYTLTDQLLVALCWPPPNRRMDKRSNSLKDYFKESSVTGRAAGEDSETARKPISKAASQKPSKSSSSSKISTPKMSKSASLNELLSGITHDVITLTPAGHGIVQIQRTTSTNDSWLSFHLDNVVLGIYRASTTKVLGKKTSKTKLSPGAVLTEEPEGESKKTSSKLPQPLETSTEKAAESASPTSPAKKPAGKPAGKPAAGAKGAAAAAAAAQAEAEEQVRLAAEAAEKEAAEKAAAAAAQAAEAAAKQQQEDAERQALLPVPGVFSLDASDGVRVTACSLPAAVPVTKPDKYGTVCITNTFPSGLQVSALSSGIINMTSLVPNVLEPKGIGGTLGDETSRTICGGGVVVRSLENSPFAKDVLYPDGSRILVRKEVKKSASASNISSALTSRSVSMKSLGSGGAAVPQVSRSSSTKVSKPPTPNTAHFADVVETAVEFESIAGFYRRLYLECPEGCKYVKLTNRGGIFFGVDDWRKETESSDLLQLESFPCIRSGVYDAETKSKIYHFEDDRLIVEFVDDQREVRFPDGTKFVRHPDGSTLFISKEFSSPGVELSSATLPFELPSIEMDLQVDRACQEHAKGRQIPINKGGEQIRSKMFLPDGSALMIKYNTSITAASNGSIKLVRRDKTSIVVVDSGELQFFPSAVWNEAAAALFEKEVADASSPIFHDPSTISRNAVLMDPQSARSKGTRFDESLPSGDRSPRSFTSNRKQIAGSSVVAPKSNKSARESPVSRSPEKVETTTTSAEKDIFLHTKALDLKVSFNINEMKCLIQDCEYNRFEINMMDPLNPVVSLAGEVDGLKPTATTDKPTEPRLFVVSRNAEATEIVSIQQVSEIEKMVELNPDCAKLVADAVVHPTDLSVPKLHSYYCRRFTGRSGDSVKFKDVFAERKYLEKNLPATAALKLIEIDAKRNPMVHGMPPPPAVPLVATINLLEQMPLSSEGYEQLKKDMSRWTEFREKRTQEINRFLVVDDRPQSEFDKEEKIRQRLKQAYKLAKVAAAKKKEKEKEQAALQAVAAGSLQPPPKGAPMSVVVASAAALLEGDEGAEEEEDDDAVSIPSSNDNREDPTELEIRAAFEEFANIDDSKRPVPPGVHPLPVAAIAMIERNVLNSDNSAGAANGSGSKAGKEKHESHDHHRHHSKRMLVSKLQAAFIQLRNRFVPQSIIDEALKQEQLHGKVSLSLPEFHLIYDSLLELMDPPLTGEAVFDDETGDRIGALSPESYKGLKKQTAPSGGNGYRTAPALQMAGAEENDYCENSAVGSFWNSARGEEDARSIVKSAPPLKFRPVVWNSNAEAGDFEVLDRPPEEDMRDLPVGSALRAARLGK